MKDKVYARGIICSYILVSASIAIFFEFIIGINALSPVNDHQFLVSLFDGVSFSTYINKGLGRFTPLESQEFVVAAKLFWAGAHLFYFVAATRMAVCAAILFLCLRYICDILVATVLWCVAFFSIGFFYTAIVLQAGELDALTLTIIFALSMVFMEKNAGSFRSRLLFVCVGLVALTVSFLYKEVMFVLAIVFGGSELVRRYWADTKIRWGVPALIFVLGLLYLIFYLFWHGLNFHGSYISLREIGRMQVATQYVGNDPFIMVFALPFAVIRIGLILIDKKTYSIYDSFLFAAISYCAAFVSMGLYSEYYFIPAYGLAVCGIGGLVAGARDAKFKIGLMLLVSLGVINNLPVAVAYAIGYKQICNNQDEFMKRVPEWIWRNPRSDGQPRNLVMVGAGRGSLVEIFISFERYLQYSGLDKSLYTIKANVPSDSAYVSREFGVSDTDGYKPKQGDLLVYNPFQNIVSPPPLYSSKYEEIFRSGNSTVIPKWTLWKWMGECFLAAGDCWKNVYSNSPYTGYAAFLLKQDQVPVTKNVVAHPSYRIGPTSLPQRMRLGTVQHIDVLVQNTGEEVWPVTETVDFDKIVDMSYVWTDEKGLVVLEGDRSRFDSPVQPGGIAQVNMAIKTPSKPGRYFLILTPLQENVQWFYSAATEVGANKKMIDIFETRIDRLIDRFKSF